MKQFYLEYPVLCGENEIPHAVRGELEVVRTPVNIGENEILRAVRGELGAWKPGQLHSGLSWTHYRTLLKVERDTTRAFYEIEAVKLAWSAREPERQINSLLFERLSRSRDKKGVMRLAIEGQTAARPVDLFKDPTVIEFPGLPESHRMLESTLEQALIDNLQTFLLELGSGFAFVSRQQRITLDGDHFNIDLVFYHMVLKCYVLIDLKVGKLSHADLGQIQFYVNYFDREKRTEGDNPTLGLILCSDKNEAVVRYTLGEDSGERQARKIFASRYQLYLPSEKALQAEIRREMRELSGLEAVQESRRKRAPVPAGKDPARAKSGPRAGSKVAERKKK
jgi:predicted nuclease of restriction endonuclease-like (RecB) superfamily